MDRKTERLADRGTKGSQTDKYKEIEQGKDGQIKEERQAKAKTERQREREEKKGKDRQTK